MRLRVVLSFVLTVLVATSAGCGCGDDTVSAGVPDGGYHIPFDAGPDSGPPPGGGVGDPCDDEHPCRPGLSCDEDSDTCQPIPDGIVGDPCTLTGECSEEPPLYCSEEGTCQPAGEGGVGDTCGSAADCQRGLYCELHGFVGTCQESGDGDWGDECTDTGDCMAGLWCGAGGECEPPMFAFPPWPGVECPDDADDSIAYFEVPRGGVAPNDFFRLPFPNDVRIDSGEINLQGFPTPGVGVLGVDLVQRYVDAIEADMSSWGMNQTVIFRFSKRMNGESITGGGDSPTAMMVDITPGSPLYGIQRGWSGVWGYRSKYICPNWFAIGPASGFPMRAGTTFAAYVTTGFEVHPDEGGGLYQRDADFEAMMSDEVPADPDLAAAHAKFAIFRRYLDDQAIPRGTILDAAVVTVGDPRIVPANMRDEIRASVAAPTASDVMLCDGVASSMCLAGGDAAMRECGAVDDGFHEIHGRFPVPVMQVGTRPYEEEGGEIVSDALGVPAVQGSEDVCFSMAIPKGAAMPAQGWPVVLYSHGTGGTFRSAITDVAADLAEFDLVAGGTGHVAVVGYDGVMHGPRRGESDSPEDVLFFNFMNPHAARDNVLQGAADLFQLVRLVEGFDVDAGSSPTGEAIRFDANRVFFLGHSQGGTVGAIFLPYEPLVQVAVLSGTGAVLRESLLSKTSPVDLPAAVELLLQENVERFGSQHPVLNLIQMWFDRSDAVNYGRMMVREPVEGLPATHLLQTVGLGDTFSPRETLQAYARSTGAHAANPILDDLGITQAGDPPIVSNFNCPGSPDCTAVVTEYDPAGAYDGHFVLFRDPDAIRQYTNFFGTAVTDVGGLPTLVP